MIMPEGAGEILGGRDCKVEGSDTGRDGRRCRNMVTSEIARESVSSDVGGGADGLALAVFDQRPGIGIVDWTMEIIYGERSSRGVIYL